MSTIFISHSSMDNEIAREIADLLARQNHHSVFLDLDPEKGIAAGQSWERTLYRKLRACRAVIALCTDHYLGSHWCFAEVALARMEGKHLIALQADPLGEHSRMPAILSDKQYIDLRRNRAEGYRRLFKGLKEMDLLGVKGEWDPKEPPYLGLGAYQEEHAPVFFGREQETRAGIELLGRGAPGLIMVLGASGSGKSSLVRAGMLPWLRRQEEDWLVVDPFRPGQDPFTELAESLARSYRRYAREPAAGTDDRERIRERLEAGAAELARRAEPAAEAAEAGDQEAIAAEDERIARLISQLEELRQHPPAPARGPWLDFLDWSLNDVKRICGAGVSAATALAAAAPATTPLVELVEHLRRLSGRRHTGVLLVIDQFEELLGHDGAEHKANRFLGLLRESLEAENRPFMILGTMRSDFLAAFQRNAALRGVDFESLSLGPMKIDGMRRVIEEPARLGGIELETGLADRLLADTETPDALPLLSFTLWVLWRDYREDGKLEIHEYEDLGGLHGAMAGEADALLASARRQGREDALRRAFVRMARLTDEGAYARLPVEWEAGELRPVHPVLERFVDRRLLVTRAEGGTRLVEVTHEALFRSWLPLKTWLENHRAELLLKQQIHRDAEAWNEHGRSADRLWRGGRLQQARELLTTRELRETEMEFVRAGVRRRQIQRWTLAGIALSVFAVLAGFLWFALKQAEHAEAQTARALQALRVAVAWEYTEKDPSVSVAFLREAEDPGSIRGWRGATGKVLNMLGTPFGIRLEGHEDLILSARYSPSGSRVVTASRDETARLWDPATGTQIAVLPHQAEVTSATFSPDGSRVYTASKDNTARVWDATTGEELVALFGHHADVLSISSSPDGRRVLTASRDRTVRQWDAATGEEMVKFIGHSDLVSTAIFSPDGQCILTASRDGTARLWDAMTFEPIATLEHADGVVSAGYSFDATRIITASSDGAARIWAADGSGKPIVLKGHEGKITTAGFSPDGQRIVTASDDGTARIWRADSPGAPVTLVHDGAVRSASFSPDGQYVATASQDGKARLWTLDGLLDSVFDVAESGLTGADYSPDGRLLVAVSRDGAAEILDLLPEIESLEARLWEQVAECPDARTRGALLGQSETEAERDFQACEEKAEEMATRTF